MAVAFDAVTAVDPPWSQTYTVSHTASGTNRFAVVFVDAYFNIVTGVTYGGQPMTRAPGAAIVDGTVGITAYWIKNPPTGAQNVVITTNTAETWQTSRIVIASYTGVDQAAAVSASVREAWGSPATHTATALAGGQLIHALSYRADTTLTTADTVRADRPNARRLVVADRLTPAAGTATASWTSGAEDNYAIAAIAVGAGSSAPVEEKDCLVRIGGVLVPAVTRQRIGGVLVPARPA